MSEVVGFALFAMGVLASLGLYMSGLAAMRQARLSKTMFRLRFPSNQAESMDSESHLRESE